MNVNTVSTNIQSQTACYAKAMQLRLPIRSWITSK